MRSRERNGSTRLSPGGGRHAHGLTLIEPFDGLGAQCFTLIELLVVVAIIAILAAMLMPALAKARGVARTGLCQSNVKQQATAIHLYADDHENRLPWAWSEAQELAIYPSPGQPVTGYGANTWALCLLPYLGDIRLYRCPDWAPTNDDDGIPYPMPYLFKIGNADALAYVTYRTNPYMGHDGRGSGIYRGGGCQGANWDYATKQLMNHLDDAADTVFSFCASRATYPYCSSPQCAATFYTGGDRADPSSYQSYERRLNLGLVHNARWRPVVLQSLYKPTAVDEYPFGKANVSFFDGHAELLPGDSGTTFNDVTDKYWRIDK